MFVEMMFSMQYSMILWHFGHRRKICKICTETENKCCEILLIVECCEFWGRIKNKIKFWGAFKKQDP